MRVGLKDIFRTNTEQLDEPEPQQRPDPADLDRMLVEELRKFGADLRRPRHARFFLYFHDRSDAEQASREVTQFGYETEIVETEVERDEQWRVIATREMVVDDASIADVRRSFGRIAIAHWGSFGGWEAAATD